MEYIKKEIKSGVTLHLIKNKNFKTDFTVFFLSLPLEKETITKNALLPAVLRSGCKKYQSYQKIIEELEMLYGAAFDCGVDKTGDNLVLKFFIESINDNYLPNKNNNLEKVINVLTEIIFNPQVQNDSFDETKVELEKRNLEMIINAQKDNKDFYAYDKCVKAMYKNQSYGLSKYGDPKDLQAINNKNLYEQYKQVIDTCKIDIIVSSDFQAEEIAKIIKENELIQTIKPREEKIKINDIKKEIKDIIEKPEEIKEELDVTQGKLVIGLDILPNRFDDFRYITIVYNAIFGNGVSSKLFQIVREKESLAYTTKSEYVVQKNNIFIRCGIECDKYQKTIIVVTHNQNIALDLIKKLLDDMKKGDFTDEEITKAKEYILAGVDSISEEQDSQILFLFGQELSKRSITIDEYKEKIKNVTRDEIIEIANKVQINTIYFLRNGGENADN